VPFVRPDMGDQGRSGSFPARDLARGDWKRKPGVSDVVTKRKSAHSWLDEISVGASGREGEFRIGESNFCPGGGLSVGTNGHVFTWERPKVAKGWTRIIRLVSRARRILRTRFSLTNEMSS